MDKRKKYVVSMMTPLERADSNFKRSLHTLTSFGEHKVDEIALYYKKMDSITHLNTDVLAVTIEFLGDKTSLAKKDFSNKHIMTFIKKLTEDQINEPEIVNKYKANILKYARHILEFKLKNKSN